MCNRYRMSAKQIEVARRFGIDESLIMPEPEDYDAWLDGVAESACALATPFPSQLMRVA